MTRHELEIKAKEFDSQLKKHPMSSEDLQNVLCEFVEALHAQDITKSIYTICSCKKSEEFTMVYPIPSVCLKCKKLIPL